MLAAPDGPSRRQSPATSRCWSSVQPKSVVLVFLDHLRALKSTDDKCQENTGRQHGGGHMTGEGSTGNKGSIWRRGCRGLTPLCCKFPPKVQPGVALTQYHNTFGALIFYLRMRPKHHTFHKSNSMVHVMAAGGSIALPRGGHFAGPVYWTRHSKHSRVSTHLLQEFWKLAFKRWDA